MFDMFSRLDTVRPCDRDRLADRQHSGRCIQHRAVKKRSDVLIVQFASTYSHDGRRVQSGLTAAVGHT